MRDRERRRLRLDSVMGLVIMEFKDVYTESELIGELYSVF